LQAADAAIAARVISATTKWRRGTLRTLAGPGDTFAPVDLKSFKQFRDAG